MKRSTLITSTLLGLLMFCCIEKQKCCSLPDAHNFFVNLQTKDGANMLNDQLGEAIDLSKTRLYLIENGNPTMFEFKSGGVLDNRYGISPVNINGIATAKISFIYGEDEKEIEGFIQWSEDLADTLNFTFNSTVSSTYLTKIAQSGTTLWDVETDPNKEAFIKLEH
ncbi:hypothetical protein [Algoriphagus sp.]|uniref:hypothetical protein n=1 Tax=Algoriphagus sp. TaxID=1872435 RepID=UPI003F728EC7